MSEPSKMSGIECKCKLKLRDPKLAKKFKQNKNVQRWLQECTDIVNAELSRPEVKKKIERDMINTFISAVK